MDGIVRLTCRDAYSHSASVMRRVDLQKAGFNGHGIQPANGVAAQIVVSNAAEDGGTIA
jgi:hypothetical protein